MEKTVLLYNFDGKRLQAVRKAVFPLKCEVRTVPKKDFSLPISSLLGLDDKCNVGKQAHLDSFTEEMLVMYGFKGEMIDILIAALKMGGVGKIELKAIVTEHNINWNSIKLYKEIKAEHDLIEKKTV